MTTKQLSECGETIKTAYEGQPDTNAFTNDEKAKLAGIEDGAQANVEVTKETLGLENVDNTSDALKPLSDAAVAALSVKANKAELSVFSTLSVPSILPIGDSTVSQNDSLAYMSSGSASTAITRYGKALGWINRLTGGSLNYVTTIDPADNLRKGSNAGVGGASITELQTRLTTGDFYTGGVPLLSRPEAYFWIQIGTNDINAGGTNASQAGYLPTLISRYTTLLQTIIDAGKIPIATTVLPRNAVDGANDWSNTTGGTTTAQKRKVLNAFNNWMMAYCREKNIICVAWHKVFSNASGDAVTGYTSDGLHPSQKGGYYLAIEAMRQVGFLFPKKRIGQQNNYDAYDATYNPYGNILNGALSGSGGSISAGSGTGTVTGTVPDNWQLAKSTSTTTSVVSSIVDRPDGLPGKMWKLEFNSLGTGNAKEEWRLSYWSGSSTSLSGFANAGDILLFQCEWEVMGGHNGVLLTPQIRAGNNSGVTYTASTISFDAATKQIRDSANGLGNFLADRAINIAGSSGNNAVVKVVSVTAGVLQLSTDSVVNDEAAGSSITLRLPVSSTNTSASVENFPDVDTGVYWDECPHWIVPTGGNITPRAAIFINGTVAGNLTIYLGSPMLRKASFRPALLDRVATDL